MRQFILELCSYDDKKTVKVFEVNEKDNSFKVRKFDGEDYFNNLEIENVAEFSSQLKDNTALTANDGVLVIGYKAEDKELLETLTEQVVKIAATNSGTIKLPIICTRAILNSFLAEYSSCCQNDLVDTYDEAKKELKLKSGKSFYAKPLGQLKIVIEKEMSKAEKSEIKASAKKEPTKKQTPEEKKTNVVLVAPSIEATEIAKPKEVVKEEPRVIVAQVTEEKPKVEKKPEEKPTASDFGQYLQDSTSKYTDLTDYRK